ncbi:P-loop containing nucleoside triphosphate hydrolase protein [Auriscalpium vulgare]|uniref:P-loop containing nucleoside triphosphate hydrolase protein n=1 Tax=Auriscalpium vulgare TaxID=40419 RepID=A0ACB8RFV1_9AGAM|nr:P-loop containing nucleoside triphosphate hydrolase protein [Auriscalpium vulgare]
MPRSTAPEVDAAEPTPNVSMADLPTPEASTQALNTHHEYTPPSASIRLLFSLLSRRDLYLLVLPAVLFSMVAGGIAPFMTLVIGQVFNTFAKFTVIAEPTQHDKHVLLHEIAVDALELLGLAAGSLALSSVTSSLWIWTGERNAMTIRKRVYAAVASREMIWFDMKMGAEDSVESAEGDGPVGAGGLMAKFARETDEVRMASSLACGMVIQHITTCITCLVLGFDRSWALTLVILSAVPALIIIQGFSQGLAGPLVADERHQLSVAATLVDRAVTAIATVKAFNASSYEQSALAVLTDKLRLAAWRLNRVWAVTSGMTQVAVMAMFVQGFWFGGKLVRDGKATAGDVMAVFWACLIATTNLQMCIPYFITLAKGKFAMSSLLTLVEAPSPEQPSPFGRRPSTASFPLQQVKGTKRKTASFRKIVPQKCLGDINLSNVSFAYPSRPSVHVLNDVSMYLPANETTFIVGGSGSGKSTIAQLLLRMYDVQSGTISLDDQDVDYLDSDWTRQQIGAVSQGAILFDMTVHDNVAMGLAGPGSMRHPQDATRAEVVAACTVALMQRFVADLPNGYDTVLGNGGANLSGGQKQRLAIARAMIRDPKILILDEATSALDATSRILVFEAIKRWRHNKTTIVITHDLSQITESDFVYVLRDGHVVEQGYRDDLERTDGGEFQNMMLAQGTAGLPEKEEDPWSADAVRRREDKAERILEKQDKIREDGLHLTVGDVALKHQSIMHPSLRPITFGTWMFDVVADLTGAGGQPAMPPAMVSSRDSVRVSRFIPPEAFTGHPEEMYIRQRRPSTLHIDLPLPSPARTTISRRLSLQFSPTSPVYSHGTGISTSSTVCDEDGFFVDEKKNLARTATAASRKRFYQATSPTKRERARWDTISLAPLTEVKTVKEDVVDKEFEQQQSFWTLIRDIYPTVPYKSLVLLGIVLSAISGAITPVFSYLLSRLLYEVSIGATDVSAINIFGGIVLAVAIADGLFLGLKYFVLETAAMLWVTRLRNTCYRLILAQDKKWFDRSENASASLMQILIKDGDDARSLIATVLGQGVVVCSMLLVGLVWALVRGWQLTLVGFAIAPVFGITMAVQTNLVAKCEFRNKRAREEVAKGYYDTILNIRGIRSMGFEHVFRERFEDSVEAALDTGVRGAFVEGCTYGVASSLIYLSEALLFYVGAVLVAHGTYSYLQMVQVLNLVVFTVSIGSQLMAFTERIAKSVQATRDFNRLLQLPTDTDESRGTLRPPISGTISFNHVEFSYPERPDVPVLRDVTMDIRDGESVAIVGSSGSGKSTIAALLQRLYEPDSGAISVGPWDLRSTDVRHLRDHVAVVSQNPNLFDATIADNISYGANGLPQSDVEAAAFAANVHDFIVSLPHGYDTMVGENAALISGGQAQRLQIARALVRPANILILDECTSALDGQNQAAVMQTIMDAKVGRTTLMVTHKLPLMRLCDRIIVVHEGTVAEQGTYDELMARRGVFAQLASGGEWQGD